MSRIAISVPSLLLLVALRTTARKLLALRWIRPSPLGKLGRKPRWTTMKPATGKSAHGSVDLTETISKAMISPVTTDKSFTNSKTNAGGVVPRKARVVSIYHADNSDDKNSTSFINGEEVLSVSLGDPECREDEDEQGFMGSWEMVDADFRPADLCLGEKYTLV